VVVAGACLLAWTQALLGQLAIPVQKAWNAKELIAASVCFSSVRVIHTLGAAKIAAVGGGPA
jgi:hypothetical protein